MANNDRHFKADETSPKTIYSNKNRPIKVKPIKKFTGSSGILLAVVFLLFIIYIGGYSYNLINTPMPDISTVEYGSMEIPDVYTGVIIRSEVAYSTPVAGTLDYNVLDTDKVRPGTAIATIQDTDTASVINDNLDKTRQQIMDLQAQRGDLSKYSDDISVIENRIRQAVNTTMSDYTVLDMTSVYKMKSDITDNLSSRNSLILSDTDGTISEIADVQKHYESQLSQYTSTVYTNESGLISFTVDGLESQLTKSQLETLTPEQTTTTPEYSSIFYPRIVEEGELIFKNVTSNTWYIVAYVNSDDLIGYSKGMIKSIYLDYNNSTLTIEGYIEHIAKGEHETYVVFSSNKYMENFIDQRNVTFRLTNQINDGYKIPNTSIISRTFYIIPKEFVVDNTIVLQNSAAMTPNQTIEIYISNISDPTYVHTPLDSTSLRPNDVLVMHDDSSQTFKIADVTSVTGVYIANRGIAEFTKISQNINVSSLDPSGFTVLDTNDNPDISVQDRIVTDATYIQENQILN